MYLTTEIKQDLFAKHGFSKKKEETGSAESRDCRAVECEIRSKIIAEAKQTMKNLDIMKHKGGKKQ